MEGYKLDVEAYLKERVDGQLKFYEQAANRAKRTHVTMQSTIIVLGILVPVLVNIPTEWGRAFHLPVVAQVVITLFSLTLALLAGIANFRRYGDLWLTYRMTEELLKTERYLFVTGSGRYAGAANPFSEFVQAIEAIVSSEHVKFREIIEQSSRPSKQGAAGAAE